MENAQITIFVINADGGVEVYNSRSEFEAKHGASPDAQVVEFYEYDQYNPFPVGCEAQNE